MLVSSDLTKNIHEQENHDIALDKLSVKEYADLLMGMQKRQRQWRLEC